jgi:hypothetical protein
MNKTKKILITLTLVSLLAGLSACGKKDSQTTTPSQKDTSAETVIENVTFDLITEAFGLQTGNEVNIDVKINTHGKQLTTAELYLNYENLEIVSIKPNELFDVWLRSGVDKDKKEIELIAGKFPPGFNGEEVFVTISAKTVGAGEASIVIDKERSQAINSDYENIFNAEYSNDLIMNIEQGAIDISEENSETEIVEEVTETEELTEEEVIVLE